MKPPSARWHDLQVTVAGARTPETHPLSMTIDGKDVGTLGSPGIAHPTKRLLRFTGRGTRW